MVAGCLFAATKWHTMQRNPIHTEEWMWILLWAQLALLLHLVATNLGATRQNYGGLQWPPGTDDETTSGNNDPGGAWFIFFFQVTSFWRSTQKEDMEVFPVLDPCFLFFHDKLHVFGDDSFSQCHVTVFLFPHVEILVFICLFETCHR